MSCDGVSSLLNAYAFSQSSLEDLKNDEKLKKAMKRAGDNSFKLTKGFGRSAENDSSINLEQDDKTVIRKKASKMVDKENQYLHVIVTSKFDDCSHAKL